jgi:hypothetical protein
MGIIIFIILAEKREVGQMRKIITLSLAVLVVLIGVATLAGCGQSAAQKAEDTYNSDVQDLKTSLAAFTESSTYSSVDSIQAAFQNLEASYNAAVDAGSAAISAGVDSAKIKISSIQGAFLLFKESVSGALSSDQTLSEKVDAIKSSVELLNASLQIL